MISNSDVLPEGIVLDERYRIEKVLGKGGFGITYEAVNLFTDEKVAIKEKREGDLAHFLREARILRDFSDDPAIVKIRDSFEDNGTAYIVMEYLDGTDLSRQIAEDGKWPAEKTIRSFVPVMKALERMHERNVIHRDVSPDNIKYMPDGSLILLDFGAVKDISVTQHTEYKIYKNVYSPPEQRNTLEELGSFSDVYSLCATIYYCITGKEPEDSLSRLLGLELERPREAGSDIEPAAEDILMHGLEPDPRERIRTVAELREALEKFYPDLSEEEKKERARRKKKRKRAILSAAAAVMLMICAAFYVFRVPVYLSLVKTESIALDGTEMTAEEFKENARIMKERMKLLVGSEYFLWKEEGQKILVTVPLEVFEEYDPQDVVSLHITRPMELQVYVWKDLNKEPGKYRYMEDYKQLGVFTQGQDVVELTSEENGYLVDLSDVAALRFEGCLDLKDVPVMFVFDYSDENDHTLSFPGLTVGDGKSVYIEMREDNFYSSEALMRSHFLDVTTSRAFITQTEWQVKWEDVNTAHFPGKCQVNPDDMKEESILLRYERDISDNESLHSGYDAVTMSAEAVFKNRLDALGVPYAIGYYMYDNSVLVIKTSLSSCAAEPIKWLGTNISSVSIGNAKGKADQIFIYQSDISDNDITAEFNSITIHLQYEQYMNKTEELLRKLIERNEDLFLYIEEITVASVDPEEALRSLKTDGSVSFTNYASEQKESIAGNDSYVKYLIVALQRKMLRSYTLVDMLYMTGKGDLRIVPSGSGFKHAFINISQVNAWKEIEERWKAEGSIRQFDEYSYGNGLLRLNRYGTDLHDPNATVAFVKDFLTDEAAALETEAFNRIDLSLYTENSLFSILGSNIQFIFEFDILEDKWNLIRAELNYFEEDREALLKEYAAVIADDPFWKDLIPKDAEETIFNNY